VYASLLARDEEEEARRTAGAVAALLALSTSILVLIGVLATPYLIDAIAPGFSGDKRETDDTSGANPVSRGGAACTFRVVPRNSEQPSALLSFLHRARDLECGHDRHDVGFGGRYAQFPLAEVLSWGSVIGSALQVIVQLPVVLRLLRGLHLSFAFHLEKRAHGRSEFFSRVRKPRRRADQRVRGCAAGEFAAYRRRCGAGLCTDAIYLARQLVWNVSLRGGTSGDVRCGWRRVRSS